MMDCLRLEAWDGALRTATVERPDVGDRDVLVDVEATGVGLTVARAIRGELGGDAADLPRIPGHELVGTVVAVGEGVTSVEPGDFVGAYFYLVCGHCRACRAGRHSLCANNAGFVGVDVDGGFAAYARLPARNAVPIPGSVDPVAASVIPDAVATPYHVADRRAEIAPGDDVLVLGAGGGVGIHMVQVARHFGGEVTAVDRRAEKLDACADLGAARTVNTATESLTAATAGRTYDAVIDFTGDTALAEAATGTLAPGGRFVHLTAFPDRTVAVAPRSLVRNEIAVLGARYCSLDECSRAADLVADGVVEPVVSEVVDLEGVPALLERIEAGDVVGRGAVTP